ncbi:GAF and ANTAR domain-containing protein [Blastococcus sp. SYSU D00820]
MGTSPAAAGLPQHLGRLYAVVGRRLRPFDSEADAARAMTEAAVELMPGADHAGLTRLDDDGELFTIGATDPVVDEVDRIQYGLGSGPCVDALAHRRPMLAGDLLEGEGWPEFGPRAAEHGIRSMLSYRLFLGEEGGEVIGGLNLYSRRPHAFDLDASLPLLSVLTTYAALALWGGRMSQQAANLKAALASSREIGIAQGVLMERHKVTREEAFGLLSRASQHGNRKLRDVAAEVADTGEFPLPPPRPSGRPGPRD